MKAVKFVFLVLLFVDILFAQDINNIPLHHMRKPMNRKEIKIPNILGYQVLKGDFHIHTVFSDGIAWPSYRVDEAWEEGLDIIAITDHIEGYPNKKFICGDHNSSFEAASPRAAEKDILLIHAAEITRSMPPGHLNALFINDANKLDVQNVDDAVKAAKDQGAFILWNHPGWKKQQPDSTKWMSLHQKYYEASWINGIEVFNEYEWYPIAVDWFINKDIAVFANSDIHDINAHYYDVEHSHRPMTLVLSEKRDLESVKDAMFKGRTIAFFDGKLVGKSEYLKALFNSSVDVSFSGRYDNKNRPIIKIKNNSDLQFDITFEDNKKVILYPERVVEFNYKLGKFDVRIDNLIVGTSKVLNLSLEIK